MKFHSLLVMLIIVPFIFCNEQNERNSMYKFTNKLINETSPYLIQHAHNPVNWYPWGEEAFKLAKEENKAVFLSIGYSSCHWCHVMEHESFENEAIAEIMNENFINIKVDREERPDIDQVYMHYVQVTTGSGGWPMSVFMTPDKKPFYGGTYFPPQDSHGRPGFARVLKIMAEYFKNDKDKLAINLAEFERVFVNTQTDTTGSDILPGASDWHVALQTLATYYEPTYGGIGRAPKFPAVNVFNVFLREYRMTGNEDYLQMTVNTLKNMAKGGIYDQVGGGFARYSVDEKWLVPHFEKMLYDNGQLVTLYLDAYAITRDNFFLDIAEETLEFVSREMTSDEGGFYSSLDADSEGEEGKFYVWDRAEIYNILGKEHADIICTYYGVTRSGNFEGSNILNIVMDKEDLSAKFKLDKIETDKIIHEAKSALLQVRNKRIRPGLDDKILASWNGLMLSAYARACQVTRNKKYMQIISDNVSFIRDSLFVDNRLKRTWKDNQAKYDAFIEDYAFIVQALLDAYEALFNPEYIDFAIVLAGYANSHFWDDVSGGYFTTSDGQEKLVVRMKDASDSSIPAAGGVMLMNNLRLFSYTEDKKWLERAEQILKKYSNDLSENPYAYASYLAGLDFYLEKPKEILIAKNKDHNIEDYLQLICADYIPNKVIMVVDDDVDYPAFSASLLKGKKTIDNKITSYVCQNFSCSLPVFNKEDLRDLLKR
jgi:uncharacterized protein